MGSVPVLPTGSPQELASVLETSVMQLRAWVANEDPAGPPDGAIGSSAARQEHRKARDRATAQLDALVTDYQTTGRAVSVSFRSLVGPLPASDLTHSVHPYPARLLRQVPRFFLACRQLAEPGDLVLDPFCGSGTVLVEAAAAGLDAWGVDANPFARLLSEVKVKPLGTNELLMSLDRCIADAKRRRGHCDAEVVNADLWFSLPVQSVLGRFAVATRRSTIEASHRRFLMLTLSLAADRLSLRDRRIPVPVRAKDATVRSAAQSTVGAWHELRAAGVWIAERIGSLAASSSGEVWVAGSDARTLLSTRRKLKLAAPRLIITSPPYGSAQKYIRSSSLSLGWLGLAEPGDLSSLERGSIGREHISRAELGQFPVTGVPAVDDVVAQIASRDSVRGAIYANYFVDMAVSMREMHSVSSDGAHLVLVVGPNTVAGEPLATHEHVSSLATNAGFELQLELVDQIRGRSLMTKRATTAGAPIHVEHIYLFRKPS